MARSLLWQLEALVDKLRRAKASKQRAFTVRPPGQVEDLESVEDEVSDQEGAADGGVWGAAAPQGGGHRAGGSGEVRRLLSLALQVEATLNKGLANLPKLAQFCDAMAIATHDHNTRRSSSDAAVVVSTIHVLHTPFRTRGRCHTTCSRYLLVTWRMLLTPCLLSRIRAAIKWP